MTEAVKSCQKIGIELDGVNNNAPSQREYMSEQAKMGNILATRKIYANFYVDDRAFNLDCFLQLDAKSICEQFDERENQ